MSAKLVIFIIVQMGALIYFIEMMRRVAKRAKEYDLKDTRETLPFGFVRLRYIVILYIATYLIWVIASILLYIFFIDADSFGNQGREVIRRNVELNL